MVSFCTTKSTNYTVFISRSKQICLPSLSFQLHPPICTCPHTLLLVNLTSGNVPTLKAAMEALFEVRAKWDDVGVSLEVDDGTLDAIRAQYADPKDRLREMLRKWLRSKHPTWKLLIEALRSPIVGEARLADTLEKRYVSPGIVILPSSSNVWV